MLIATALLIATAATTAPLATVAAKTAPLATAGAPKHVASVYFDGSTFSFIYGVLDAKAAVAWGSFSDSLNVTGWGVLELNTSSAHNDTVQHHAAGMLEGALTCRHIYTTYRNTFQFTFGDAQPSANLTSFLTAQDAWTRAQIAQHQSTDVFWAVAAAIQAQFDGLVAGYAIGVDAGMPGAECPPLHLFAFQLLNGVGDLFQIIPAVDRSKRPDWSTMSMAQKRATLLKSGHCSALIRVFGALEDLLMAHSSWFEYANTNRIFKYYHFAFRAPAAANSIAFSSYPGYLESLDDFYMMDSGLGMVQTSNGIPNNALLDLITPNSLLAWQRVRIASALASSGAEYYEHFKTAASGTYVNQYMVVDFKLFSPGMPLAPNTLWVLEEIPGLVEGADQTPTLARGYWPSYNVPFYAEVYKRSGYAEAFDAPSGVAAPSYDGGGLEYTIGAPRSKIFRRDHGKVDSMATFREFMRYANYSDPYAIGADGAINYGAAICERGDLRDGGTGGAGGCYDSKVTSALTGFWQLACDAVNGPSSKASAAGSVLEPFEWRAAVDNATLHMGLPARFDFPFVRVSPGSVL